MNSSSRIPPLLQPYVKLPCDDSLLLLTSTLGASANWLLVRFLYDALSNNTQDSGVDEVHNVVLVSWLRDYEFWKQEARKSAGLDLERLKREKRFAFVDGLSGLSMGDAKDAHRQPHAQDQYIPSQSKASTQSEFDSARFMKETPSQRTSNTLPIRGPPGRVMPARGPPAPSMIPAHPATNIAVPSTTISKPGKSSELTPGYFALASLDLTHLKATLTAAISSITTQPLRKTFVILDTPDILLAMSSITTAELVAFILTLHDLPTVSHILAHVHADTPLLAPSIHPQPLEIAQYNFITKVAHMSRRIMGTRVLDTGVARDVSGVVRVTEQRIGWGDLGLEDDSGKLDAGDSGKGKEFLYQVKGDGSVKVFERGAGGEG